MNNIEEVKYTKTTNYTFDINGRKIELNMEEILILQKALEGIVCSSDKKVVFLD